MFVRSGFSHRHPRNQVTTIWQAAWLKCSSAFVHSLARISSFVRIPILSNNSSNRVNVVYSSQRMQYGFTNDVVALAQLQGASGDVLQSICTSQAFRHDLVSKHLPQSPASTVSDHSDHSDGTTVSEASSQSEYSELEGSPSSYDHLSQKHSFDHGIAKDNRCPPRSVPSAFETEPQLHCPLAHSRVQHVSTFEYQGASITHDSDSDDAGCLNDRSSRGSRCSSFHQLIQQDPVSAAQDSSLSQANQLAYRSRPQNTIESLQESDRTNSASAVVEPTTKPSIDQPPAQKPTQTYPSRCYPSILNPFAGYASSRSTPAESPQHVQTNSRRRPVNSALPPPKLRRDTDNTDAIVRMIVIFCTNLIQSIWPVDNTPSPSTCHPSTQPGGNVLPLQVFITETLRRSKTSYSTLQIALFYLILLKQCLPELASPGQSGQSGCRAMLCGRRMFLTALILASKYLQDRNYSARAWSKISGLPMKEINDNERRYLRFVGWDLHVPKDAFENWSKIVLAICRLSTGQDFPGQEPHQPPPSPPAPCFADTFSATRKGQLQNMCPDSQMHAVRAWWVFNLQALRTEVVRCPRKTEQYVSSIPQLRGAPILTRPLFETKSVDDAERNMVEQALPSIHKLSRPSSMVFVDPVQQNTTDSQSSTPRRTMPPPPPMLGLLPTPQTTPRSDMTSIWRTSPTRSSSRCRDAASLLRGLERPCAMANMEKLPMPRSFMTQPSPGAWLPPSLRTRDYFQTPDSSLTSSPESIVSDLSSMSGFAGRSRTSSFSSISSRSTLSQMSNATSDPERCEGFKRQLNSIDAQIAPRVHDWRKASMEKESGLYVPQTVSRPQTAFRVSTLTPGCTADGRLNKSDVDSDSVIDEGYWSSEYSQEKREERKRQTAAQALLNMQQHAHADLTPVVGQMCQPKLQRPALGRSHTQVFIPKLSATSTQHTLKRSRSESFDVPAEASLSDLPTCNTSHAQARNIQQSCRPWADSKQPVFCGTQDTNKRIAVQSAAATRASAELRMHAASCFKGNVGPSKMPLWQSLNPSVQDIHV